MSEAPPREDVDLKRSGGGDEAAIMLPLRDGLRRHPKGARERRYALEVVDHVLQGVHTPNLSMLSSYVKHAGTKNAYSEGMDTPGDRLRQMRKMRGMTLEEVGAVIGVSAQAISMIETGSTKGAKPENFLRLCAFYDVDPYQVAFGAPKGEIASALRLRRATRKT